MPRCLYLLVALAVLGPEARAAGFTSIYKITAKFQCPFYIRADGELDLQFRPENRVFRPCAGLHVVAKQPGLFGDGYCGEDYTAADGSIRLRASTDCVGDVYLAVEAASLQGFSVGTHDFPFWRVALDAWGAYVTAGLAIPGEVYDFLVANQTFEWDSPTRSVDAGTGDTVDFGSFAVGDDGDHNSRVAADVFPVASLTMKLLAASGHLPDAPAFTINHPIFGTPTTIWKTILFKDSKAKDPASYPRMLRNVAHELGHATYNRYHSGQAHWLEDGRFYLADHFRCQPLDTLRFAWYEGFADFVESYVDAQALQARGGLELTEAPPGDPFYHIQRGCYFDGDGHAEGIDSPPCDAAAVGFDHEANVQALLDQTYFGEYRAAFRAATDRSTPVPIAGTVARSPHRPGNGQYTRVALPDGSFRELALPSIADVFGWIEAAGTSTHTARELLDAQIVPWCAAGDPARYCASATFANELRYLDATGTPPPDCAVAVGPVAETAGVDVATDIHLAFVDAAGSPVDAEHFGALHPGQSKTATVMLTNLGAATATVDMLYVSSGQFFQLAGAPALPLALAPGASVPVTVELVTGAAESIDVSTYLFAASSVVQGLSLPGASADVRFDGTIGSSALCAQVTVTTIAGNGQTGQMDGTGAGATFASPFGLAVAPNGDAYVTEAHGVIRRVTPDGVVTTLTTGAENSADIAVDSAGKLYLTYVPWTAGTCGVITVDPDGTVRHLAGGPCGYADGPGATAAFFYPDGIAVGGDGTVYVADFGNHRVRAVAPDGTTTTLAGNGGRGSIDGIGTAASFESPAGLALHGDTLYVVDYGSNNLRQIDLRTAAVTTRLPASALPPSTSLGQIAATSSGALLFPTNGGDTLNLLMPGSATVELLAGGTTRTPDLFADGDGCSARFDGIFGLGINGQTVTMSDHYNLRIRRLVLP